MTFPNPMLGCNSRAQTTDRRELKHDGRLRRLGYLHCRPLDYILTPRPLEFYLRYTLSTCDCFLHFTSGLHMEGVCRSTMILYTTVKCTLAHGRQLLHMIRDCDDDVPAHTIAKKYESDIVGAYNLDILECHIYYSEAAPVYGSSSIIGCSHREHSQRHSRNHSFSQQGSLSSHWEADDNWDPNKSAPLNRYGLLEIQVTA